MISAPYKYLTILITAYSGTRMNVEKFYYVSKEAALKELELIKKYEWKLDGLSRAEATLKDSRYKVIDKINLLD